MKFLEVCETDISSDIIIENNIVETENYLKSVAEEYNIDYKTNEISPIEYLYEDSIFSKIKNFIKMIFQKAIQFLVKIWKFITNLIKKAWNFFTNLIKRIMGKKTDNTQKIELKSGFISLESAKFQEETFKSKEEIRDEYKKSLTKISNKIKKLSYENINFMKRLESKTNSKVAKESFNILEEKVVYNDKFFNIDINNPSLADTSLRDAFTSINDVNIVVQGKSYIEHQGKYDLKILSTKRLEAIKKAKTLSEGYNMLIEGHLDEMLELYTSDPSGFNEKSQQQCGYTIESSMCQIALDMIKQGKYTLDDIIKYFRSTFYPDFHGTEQEIEMQINQWVNLKINYNKSLINCLSNMVKNNTDIFGISMKEADLITQDLSNENYDSIKKLIRRRIYDFIKFDRTVLDFREIGLGCVVISDAANDGFEGYFKYNKWSTSIFDGDITDLAIQYLTKYDITVISHGNIDTDGRWIVDPVKTPNGSGPYTDMEDYIRKLISEGFKRINVASCNPGGVILSEDLRKNKKVLIQMSKSSTLIS